MLGIADLKIKESERIVENYNSAGWVDLKNKKYYTLELLINDKYISADYIEVDELIALRLNIGMISVKDELIKICNKIYQEHVRYRLTNSSYPNYYINMDKYAIQFHITLCNYTECHNTLEHIIVSDFVESVGIDFNKIDDLMRKVQEITLPDKIQFEIHWFPYNHNIKINNYENIISLSMAGVHVIAKNAVRNNQKIVFNHIDSLRWPSNLELNDSDKIDIVFNDTCTISRLPRAIAKSEHIRSVRLCKSLEVINTVCIEEYIKQDNKGRKYLDYEGNIINIIED
ncbi:MAG: hypothetical protein J6A59_17895 [Lachnospiraceae bacterium]|nr:hypothetical protein [Lachnospiraceae bacterium]